jgi:hypothetical protein
MVNARPLIFYQMRLVLAVLLQGIFYPGNPVNYYVGFSVTYYFKTVFSVYFYFF